MRPKPYREPTPEERDALDDEETRRAFAPFLARAKRKLEEEKKKEERS